MAKPSSSFKLRLSRIFPSFHSCRSKNPSILPENPVPSSLLRFFPNPSPASKLRSSSSFRRHVSSSILPCGHSCGSSRVLLSDDDHPVLRSQRDYYTWKKEDQWHVVARIKGRDVEDDEETPRKKIYNTSASAGDEDTDENDDDVLVLPPLTMQRRTKRRGKYRKKRTTPGGKLLLMRRLGTSSADSSGLFSNDDDDGQEFETLVPSSRSFTTETSSDTVNHRQETISEKKSKKKKKRATNHSVCMTPESGGASPARLSVFKKMIPCVVDVKVRESYAVVKKSENPYEDFKRSMMEMIVEKKMFEEKDLEQLLHCFLSLNARDHHGVIVEAFTDIWELMFRKNWSESDA